MRFIKYLCASCAAVFLFLGLGGCGGGFGYDYNLIAEGTGQITSLDAELQSGAHCDKMLGLRTERDGWICIDMTSYEVDPYVLAWVGSEPDFTDDTYIGSNDDISDYDSDARLVFPCYEGMYFSVKFTTYGANDFGSYYYRIHHVNSWYAATSQANPAKKALSLESYRTLAP